MNQRGCILVNSYEYSENTQYQVERLTAEFGFFGVSMDVKTSAQAGVQIFKTDAADALGDYDFVIYLDKDKYAASLLEKRGHRLFNSANSIELCDDKMTTHIALANLGIRMPDTIPGTLCYTPSAKIDTAYADSIAQRLGFPLVVKECYGSLGKGVHLVQDMPSLLQVMEQIKLRPHLFQRYIVSSHGRDVRVIVIGKKAFAWMLRKSDGDFRSNIALGGTGEKITLPQAFLQTAERAAEILQLDYCGVDLMFGESGEPILCEVNSNAFFSGIERVTGENIGKAYAEHIWREIYVQK